MIPTPRALAQLALRRQEDLSRQLSKAYASPGSSLLPEVLRRAIVTVAVCHEIFRTLQAAIENGSRSSNHRFPQAAPGDGGWSGSGRYGFVADSMPMGGPRFRETGDVPRVRRAQLALAVDSALLAYGDLLNASDRRSQRAALDSLLDYLGTLETGTEPELSPRVCSVADASRRIRVVLDVRRNNAESFNPVYRDLESFTVEGMAWSYCAALLVEELRPETRGAVDARAAVRRVDEVREGLEKPSAPAAVPAPPFEDRARRSTALPKP